MSASIEPGSTFRAGTPRLVFERRYEFPGWDVAPDGKRFVMIKGADRGSDAGQMYFVLEWFEEVRRRVQAGATPP